jgi:hypothetical protein
MQGEDADSTRQALNLFGTEFVLFYDASGMYLRIMRFGYRGVSGQLTDYIQVFD